jgi:murein DD-endopeptidase MepM/ murein hydrolase activator NlpD
MRARDRWRRALLPRTDDWRRDLRTFAAGAGCGFVGGAILVALAFWQFHWIVPPWTTRQAAVQEAMDPGAKGIETEWPTAMVGRARAPASASEPVSTEGVIGPVPSSPAGLEDRNLLIPVEGVAASVLTRQFSDERGGSRRHEAIDILAPRNTPVRAVEDGTIARLFFSKAGGTTVYQFDPSSAFCYYYAHLERYAYGLSEGQRVRKGQVIGYVGTSGNAPKTTPHLHFAIFRLTEAKRWWEGTPIDPYDVLR